MNSIRTLLVNYLVQNRRLIGSLVRPQRLPIAISAAALFRLCLSHGSVLFFPIMGEQSIKLATLQA